MEYPCWVWQWDRRRDFFIRQVLRVFLGSADPDLYPRFRLSATNEFFPPLFGSLDHRISSGLSRCHATLQPHGTQLSVPHHAATCGLEYCGHGVARFELHHTKASRVPLFGGKGLIGSVAVLAAKGARLVDRKRISHHNATAFFLVGVRDKVRRSNARF